MTENMISILNRFLFKFFGLRLIGSQTGEDLIAGIILNNKNKVFYIDVGANHPTRFNNTLLFKDKGGHGINIEPNPQKIKSFEIHRRRDINLNIGIGQNKKEMDFYVLDEDTLSTFDPNSAEELKKMGHKINKIIKINVVPLKDVLSEYCKNTEIDLLTVDTEGFDLEVIRSNDWAIFRPKIVILETLEYKRDGSGKKINKIFDDFMDKVNYEKVADTYINTIYRRIDRNI